MDNGQGSGERCREAGEGIGQEAIGKVTGDTKTQAEGAAEKAAGRVQGAMGGAKDSVRDVSSKKN